MATASVLAVALSADAISALSQETREKLEGLINSKEEAVKSLKTQHEKLKVNSEQRFQQLETQWIKTNTQLDKESAEKEELQKLKTSLEEKLNKSEEQLSHLKERTEGSLDTHQELSRANEQLKSEKMELVTIIERKSKEVQRLNGDTTPPIISNCPSDITITIPHMSTSGEVTWTEPTAMDLSGSAILFSRSAEPGSVFDVGVTLVTYIFRDPSVNKANCSFLVIVQTDAPDQIIISNCPGNIEVTTEPNEDVRVVWSEPTASIAGQPASLQRQSHTSPAVFSPGETTVVYIFRDDAGNTATCNFTVTVLEVDPLQCTETNITAEASPEQSFAAVNWTTAALTNYTEGLFVNVTNYIFGGVFSIGLTDVDYVLFDKDGRTLKCFFTVIVFDVTPPVISDCPNDVSIGPSNGVKSLAVMWEEPTASDNSGNVTETKSNKPGDSFQIGTSTVLYQFSDTSGNTATCSFDIILNGKGGDDSPPDNGLFQNDFVVTILASSGIILIAVIFVAICLASMCCCRNRSSNITSSIGDIDIDDNYFTNAYEADEQGYRYVNNGFTRSEVYAEGKYDEPPTMSQTLKYNKTKANGHGLPSGGHYSQTLPSRPIHDPLDEGTRTIKHSYNGPIPGQNGNGVKPKNNYPPLEVELQQPIPSYTEQRQTFLPIPEEIDMGDYLEIKGTAL